MRQTSLIQSWSRALNPTTGQQQGANSNNCHLKPHNHGSESNDSFDSNFDHHILAEAFEKFNRESVDRIGSKPLIESPDDSIEINPALLEKLRQSKVAYRPTGNDSSQLDHFDVDAGHTWIYPTNAAFRDYQFHITEQCLYKNTLVCLPTGLGKTFIAAVVMHNFLRWYPTGKSVFMAPTRPLVTQQLAACRRLIGLAADSVVELTGSIAQSKRRELWSRLRVFFLTPQILANDLEADVCPATDLRLLVFDEAHKATGNHAYCQVLRFLTGPPHMHRQFRILALSATPAADIQGVQSLIANLLISHLELRTESSADVKRFTQTRDLETIVVPLGPELRQFQNLLFSCIRTPLERLRIRGAFLSSAGDLRPERLAKYTVVKAREAWSTSPQASSLSPVDVSAVQCDFGLLICLLHAMELLEQHGLRPLYHYLSGVLTGQRSIPSVRTEMMRLPGVSQLWSDLSTRFGDSFGNTPSTQSPFNGGHPKLEKLRELLSNHFGGKHAADTRVIVFSQFRDSVEEIMLMLKQLRPLVRPACFMGHSSGVIRSPTAPVTSTRPSICASGVSQREQLRVMSAFREGIFNTLVSTCVGEEGLDVGQVDLIVCFDAFKSPIRLAQRLGRTGRKRYGRIVMLLTEGREERNYQFSIARTTSIHKALLEGGAYKRLAFYPHNPRMVPIGLDPQVLLQNLNQTRLENSISCSKDGTSVKCKSSRPSKIKTHVDRAMGSVRFHIEAIGVVNLNLIPLGSGDFHCLTDSVANANLPCLTDLFKVNTSDRLRATREQLQAYKFDGSNANGPATSTLHFMSVLRLCELHRRGLTCLSFHALGLRSVDVETPFSCLVPESDCLSKCTQGTLAPLVDHQDKKPSETVMSVIPGEVSLVPLRPAAVFKTFTFPSVIRGLVSEQFFFNPKVDSASVEEMKNADLHLRSLSRHNNDQIEYHFLEKNWTQYITDMVTEYPPKTRISSQTRSPPTEHIKSLVTPEQWVDSSLLKAITGPSQEKLEIKSCDSLCSSAGVVAENHISSFCLEATESPFSLRFSSTSLPGAGIAARSTPYVKPRNHNLSVLQPTNDLSRSGPSQLKLDEALALLERSTIRLEASTLLDDQPTQTVLHSTALNSAVFGGPPNRLQFDTKLSLGDDFGEGLLFPSQAVGGSGNQPTADPSSQSTQLASSFELPSQIDWSPVMEDAHPPGEGPSPNRNESVPSIFPVVSEELESPVAPLRRRARKVRKDRLLLQTQPGNVDFERKSCGSRCQLLLTQAEQSTNDIDEHDSDTPTLDTYESSFIDDRDVNANSRSSAYLNNSAMLSVYLQTARSPPLGAKGQISLRELLLRRRDTIERPLLLQRQEPRANKRDSPETSNINFDDPHLSSQTSDDGYELDSFCVNSADSTSVDSMEEFPTQRRPKRHRALKTRD